MAVVVTVAAVVIIILTLAHILLQTAITIAVKRVPTLAATPEAEQANLTVAALVQSPLRMKPANLQPLVPTKAQLLVACLIFLLSQKLMSLTQPVLLRIGLPRRPLKKTPVINKNPLEARARAKAKAKVKVKVRARARAEARLEAVVLLQRLTTTNPIDCRI